MRLDELLRRAWTKGEELVFRERTDPLRRRVTRLARVAQRIELLSELHPLAAPAVAQVVLQSGLSVRSVHAVHARHTPDRPAIVDARGVRSYAEVDRDINRAAHAFRDALGVKRGEAVALAAENRAEYLIAWFALMRLGARAVHVSYRSKPAELEYVVQHAQLRAMLISGTTLDAAREVQRSHPSLQLISADGAAPGAVGWTDLLDRARSSEFPETARRHAGSESVVYTSGTTGKPKGAVRDFAHFGVEEGARILERLPFQIGERHLIVAPLYHSAAQAFALIESALGATIHLLPHFDAQQALETISREQIHSLFLVPTMLRRLVDLPAELRAEWPTSSLRALVCGASEFPEALRREAIAMFGAPAVHDFYGATELGWVTLINGEEMLSHPGSVGRPLPGQRIAILGADGRRLKTGETGLVYVRNAQTMSGYLGDIDSTNATRRGPWVTVEDLGRLDADGYLYLSGRERDMVKSGGVNLYPVEIEDVIAQHPAVRDVAVIGVPDPAWGERLVGILVPRGELDPHDVERFARERLSSLKVPKEWHLVEELPRNATGKVLKRALRERFAS